MGKSCPAIPSQVLPIFNQAAKDLKARGMSSQDARKVAANLMLESIDEVLGLPIDRVIENNSKNDINNQDLKWSVGSDGLIKAVAFKEQNIVAFNDSVYSKLTDRQKHALALHEIGVHIGLERMIGTVEFNKLLDQLEALKGKSATVDKAFASVPADTKPEHIREEALAYLVENHANLSVIKQIIAAIRDWFNQTFRGIKLTDSEITALATTALRQYENDVRIKRMENISRTPVPGFVKVNFQRALNSNPIIKDIFEKFTYAVGDKAALTGSLALSTKLDVYRNEDELIHDLDFVISESDRYEVYNRLSKQFPNGNYVGSFRTKGTNYTTTAIAIPNKPDLKLLHTIRITEGGYQIMGQYAGSDQIVLIPKSDYLHIDIFVKDPGVAEAASNSHTYTKADGSKGTVQLSDPKDTFDAKFAFMREKDITDAIFADVGGVRRSEVFGSQEFNDHGYTAGAKEVIDQQNFSNLYWGYKSLVPTNQRDYAHSKYLDTLLTDYFGKLNQNLVGYTVQTGTTTNSTFGKVDTANKTVDIYVNHSPATTGLDLHPEEVFLHEATHITTANLLNSAPFFIKQGIMKLYNEAREVLTPEDLLGLQPASTTSLEAAKARYDYIFSDPKKGIHEFVAFGMTNQAFRKAISDKVKLKKDVPKTHNPIKKLQQLFLALVDWIGNRALHINDKDASVALSKLVFELNGLNKKNRDILGLLSRGLMFAPTQANKAIDFIIKPIIDFGKNPKNTGNTSKTIRFIVNDSVKNH